ncbi:hypothetical protein GH733_008026 [Mirounga leonina]|nr:hypothetical protein GH733_008026 [Mirounga leonina]
MVMLRSYRIWTALSQPTFVATALTSRTERTSTREKLQNFTGQNNVNPKIHTFIASPKLITTLATPGILRFNSETDFLRGKNGRKFKLEAPDADEFH